MTNRDEVARRDMKRGRSSAEFKKEMEELRAGTKRGGKMDSHVHDAGSYTQTDKHRQAGEDDCSGKKRGEVARRVDEKLGLANLDLMHCPPDTPPIMWGALIQVRNALISSELEREKLAEDRPTLLEVNAALRKRIHHLEKHNQYFFRCESGWCNPGEDFAGNPALETLKQLNKGAEAAEQRVGELSEALQRVAYEPDRWSPMDRSCKLCDAFSSFDASTNTSKLEHKPECVLAESALSPKAREAAPGKENDNEIP